MNFLGLPPNQQAFEKSYHLEVVVFLPWVAVMGYQLLPVCFLRSVPNPLWSIIAQVFSESVPLGRGMMLHCTQNPY